MGNAVSYVYMDVEVKKTGRVARKPGPGGKEHILEEITPTNPDDGTWKKWVVPSALYEVDAGV